MEDQKKYPSELNVDKQEWLESLDYIHQEFGDAGVMEIMRALQSSILQKGLSTKQAVLNTPYLNTISSQKESIYPGNLVLEKRIENILRWNAMAMVLQGYDSGCELGGHISSFAGAVTIMEVAFNHFLRKKSVDYGGDFVLLQGTTAPGTYARAYLEGRLSEVQLMNYRRELADQGGLSSYSHPRSMPDFWEVPNGSMGLSIPTAIYQARFAKYLEARGLKPKNGGRVWCFIGDGETDEPEVLGTLNIASREKLDNLVVVICCNLQRLDGPVRGNGKIIQELESSFTGANWNVFKVIWGSDWDVAFAQDSTGVLRQRLEQCLDGDYQQFSTLPGEKQRELLVDGDPELEGIMSRFSDEEIEQLKRGGQDPRKIYAAYDQASASDGPAVILIKAVKGDGLGAATQGSNTAHQKKNFSIQERQAFARALDIPLDFEAAAQASFYRPPKDSDEIKYLLKQRKNLGGCIPDRQVDCARIDVSKICGFDEFKKGSGKRQISTTTATVRLISRLLKDEHIGKFVVPIVPDEARTFGMESLFKPAGIYSPGGQNYTPVDAKTLLPYREAEDGQIFQEGICEIGAMGTFLAAGTSYAVHGLPMVPFYLFYSMFGPQRMGDMIWHCADMICRGFMFGGTAGRTTLNGEGIQHQDGQSLVLGSCCPNLLCYDPAFAFEIAIIVRHGIHRMYAEGDKVFYYLTLYNESYAMPAITDKREVEQGIIRGGYCFKRSQHTGHAVHLLASGGIVQQAIEAASILENMGYAVNIWSITSYSELYRDAEASSRWNRLHAQMEPSKPYVKELFSQESGVFVAVTDHSTLLPNSIAKWMPDAYCVLGTDGFGLSESRQSLRDYFEISPGYIVGAALEQLFRHQHIDVKELSLRLSVLDIDCDKPDPADR